LVGKGAQQRDLTRGEAPSLGPSNGDRTDRAAILEHRHRREALAILRLGDVTVRKIGISVQIGDLRERPRLDGPGRGTGPAG
jgi:hypothetical protein